MDSATKRKPLTLLIVQLALLAAAWTSVGAAGPGGEAANETDALAGGALAGHRPRVLVSTDIGGTDPDDFQSMVHLLVYADVLDLEGLVSSPYGPGRKEHILEVINCYARDCANLRTYSDCYPTPDALRAAAKQGEMEVAPYAGVRQSTEGSEWIVKCARRDDPRPLHVLIWGGIEDLAQALHDAPDILPKLRVYFIGGPNKKWGPHSYQYIADHHPALWIIEANATYRGWFTGGSQEGEWNNQEFVARHVRGHGALGDFFASKKGDIKMGDTPSVAWLLQGRPDDPSKPGWGGRFVRAWERPCVRFRRITTKEDRMEVFGILELALPLGDDAPAKAEARLDVENQSLSGHVANDKTIRFRFCPKAAQACRFTIHSNVPSLHGKAGGITAVHPSPNAAMRPSARFPHWWTDDPAPEFAEGPHAGAKTVSRWREEFLRDFARRMDRCKAPAPSN
ncbi:MAG TPA: DUF1593 domain-containing protein [Candidatus Paceibacterota bacterium]|nr:DUF1593 domain-containing protein [Verrucomicrobiota bacterium]HRZ45555.1 DUF1593 domain-containing protein [Candidatus Paceibacterota bacterium]HRZ94761.1 DUF1593 domain-containing protein [Candidatus Paceibacterota bacterium]